MAEDIKLIVPIVALITFCFGLYQYWKSKPIYKFIMFHHIEPNTDGCGNYLCGRIHISNSGGKVGVFNGFIAVEQNGQEFYPISTLNSGQEIDPEKTITGVIPIGHLISNPPKALYMIDGLLKKRQIPNKIFKKTINGLIEEKLKYERAGILIHPTKGIKKIA